MHTCACKDRLTPCTPCAAQIQLSRQVSVCGGLLCADALGVYKACDLEAFLLCQLHTADMPCTLCAGGQQAPGQIKRQALCSAHRAAQASPVAALVHTCSYRQAAKERAYPRRQRAPARRGAESASSAGSSGATAVGSPPLRGPLRPSVRCAAEPPSAAERVRNIGTAVLEAVESVVLAPPRSPFNTGSVDVTTAGAASLTDGRMLATEKQVMIVRHGLTTWNEQRRIQARRQGYRCSCDSCAHQTLAGGGSSAFSPLGRAGCYFVLLCGMSVRLRQAHNYLIPNPCWVSAVRVRRARATSRC